MPLAHARAMLCASAKNNADALPPLAVASPPPALAWHLARLLLSQTLYSTQCLHTTWKHLAFAVSLIKVYLSNPVAHLCVLRQ
jgi:hypothetical protein